MVNAFFILGKAAQHIGSPGTDGEGKSDLSFLSWNACEHGEQEC